MCFPPQSLESTRRMLQMAEEVRLWHSATIIDTEEQCLSRRDGQVLMSSCWMGIRADLLLISEI